MIRFNLYNLNLFSNIFSCSIKVRELEKKKTLTSDGHPGHYIFRVRGLNEVIYLGEDKAWAGCRGASIETRSIRDLCLRGLKQAEGRPETKGGSCLTD